jgi:subtilase family serine protease
MHHLHRPHRAARRGLTARLEVLEARALLSVGRSMAVPAVAHPAAEVRSHPDIDSLAKFEIHQAILNVARTEASGRIPGYAHPLLVVEPMASSSPTGLSPAQVRHAYGFDKLSQNGSGQTIYIVDAYNDPNISSDLASFDSHYGLAAPPSFKVEYAQGNKPTTDSGWALEMSLDVEWAHAIAPKANIVLVEAENSSDTDMYGAVDYAVKQGAHIVSMSWGSSDASGESSDDSHFEKSGVTFLAAAGDSGGQVLYPSASPYVVSVGGTSLSLDSSGNYKSESAWSSGGGGPSKYESEPGYQKSYGISLSGRGTPDVAYDANPGTGFSVYDTVPYGGRTGWFQVGGTSAGAPQWAALVALADQGRSTPLSSDSLTKSPMYDAATGSTRYAGNYHDITTGSNGYNAKPGYDLATGLGSPKANSLVPWLIANN